MFPIPQGEKVKIILCYIKQRTQVWYLFAVALTFLSSSNRIKCRNEVHRTISKIFTTCNRGLVYAQRVGILKYRVSLTIGIGKRKTLTHCNLWQCNTTMKTLLHILLRLHWFTLYKYEKTFKSFITEDAFLSPINRKTMVVPIYHYYTQKCMLHIHLSYVLLTPNYDTFSWKKKKRNVSAKQ